MNFIAIDFETANSNRNSPCEIGIVKVENFKITDRKSFLIKPKENYFDWMNTEIHGIDEDTVKNEPEFNVIYSKIKDDFENYPIIAHNASFDISVLRHTLDLYDIPYPRTEYTCTYQMAKSSLEGCLSYRLDAISKFLDIKLDHHRALSDANACAEIAIKLFNDKSITDFSQIKDIFKIRTGELNDDGYKPSLSIKNKGYKISDLEYEENLQPENPFFEKNIVFTGTLTSMVRREAQIKVLELGGKCSTGVNNSTNFLIVGEQDYSRYGEGSKSSKMKKAESLLSKGQEIELLSENQFIEMIQN
jgi:DNA polymerase III subunit epsilon